jgi:hypothetical protein
MHNTIILTYLPFVFLHVLKRGVASLMGDNLVIIYYLCASEICPEKRSGLPYGGQFTFCMKRWPYKRGTTVCHFLE